MRWTRRGLLLLAVGASAFPLALVLHAAAPALVGVLLVALALAQRAPVVDVTARREAPARVVAGEPFEVVTILEDAGGARVHADDDAPPGLRMLARVEETKPGRAIVRARVVADDPGLVLWESVRVRFGDAWGLREDALRLSLPTSVEVAPDRDALLKGKRAGQALKTASRTKSARGHDREPEVERLRDFQPGDRLRDVAWAQVSKLGRLITRELRRESVLPVIVLLQATPSMRRARRRSKLASCARAALAVAAAANARGVGVGLVAWSEHGVEAQTRVASGRRALAESILRLANLPPALPARDAPSAPAASRPLEPAERAFLAASHAFSGAAAGVTPTEAALAALGRVATQPSIVVAFLDVEETPELAGALLARLKAHGHKPVLVCPASGAHAYARKDVDAGILRQLLAWRAHRAEAASLARRHGAPFVVLGPSLTDETVEGVVRSAA